MKTPCRKMLLPSVALLVGGAGLLTAATAAEVWAPEPSSSALPQKRVVRRDLHTNGINCAWAKFDVWFERGRYTYSLFTGASSRVGSEDTNDNNGTMIVVGGEGCRYRIRIEKAD
jgi:hypothetical protein